MPTTNPVPSTDPSDLLFNAGKLDEVVNGAANSFTDRLGVARRTVAGMNADFDAQLADAESDLNVYRADAAASASQALGYLNVIRATSYGAYAEDPATDPLGNPPTVGDEYFNTTANLLKRWNGTTWQASDINTANLAAPSGASLVGYIPSGTGAVATTVQEKLRQTFSVKDFGAVGDGVTDDTLAIQAALNTGKRIYGEGDFLISAKLFATKEGTHLVGNSASWSNESHSGRAFRLVAAAGLSADFLIEFKNPDRPNLRSVGMENVGIDLQTNSPDCGGVAVYGAYDSSAFRSVVVTGVAPSRIGFWVSAGSPTPYRSGVTQTVVFENVWSYKRRGAGDSTAPAIHVEGTQECTFINCKASHSGTNVAAWRIASSGAVTLVTPSFVNEAGYGLDIVQERGGCYGLTITAPTFENCLKTIRTRSTDAYMFGTITTPPAIGDIVKQPADGSTATGIVWQGSTTGVYAIVTSGAFTTGTLYSNSGASIGTVSGFQTFGGNRNIELLPGRTIGGATVGGAGGGEFKALSNSRIELPDDSNDSYTHVYTADDSAVNNVFSARKFGNMIAAGKYNEIKGVAELTFVYEGSPSTDFWPFANEQFNLVSVPAAVRRITLIRPRATTGFISVLGSGVIVLPYAASTVFRVFGGKMVLRRKDAITWLIESAEGNIITTTAGRVSEAYWTQTRTSTFAADSNTVAGCTIVNTGATGTVSVNMSAIGSASTLVGTRFTVRRVASQPFRVTTNAADTILGASAAGKYVQLDSDGAFLTLEVMAANTYNIVASQGAFSFQP